MKKLGQLFHVLTCLQKSLQKSLWLVCTDTPSPFPFFFTEGRGRLYTGYRSILWVSKGTKYWLQNRIALQQWYLHGMACSSMVWFCPKLLLLLLSTPSPKGEENLSVLRSLILRINQKNWVLKIRIYIHIREMSLLFYFIRKTKSKICSILFYFYLHEKDKIKILKFVFVLQ